MCMRNMIVCTDPSTQILPRFNFHASAMICPEKALAFSS